MRFGKTCNNTLGLLRRGHANLLCIVPILVYVLREQYDIKTLFLVYIHYLSDIHAKVGNKLCIQRNYHQNI